MHMRAPAYPENTVVTLALAATVVIQNLALVGLLAWLVAG